MAVADSMSPTSSSPESTNASEEQRSPQNANSSQKKAKASKPRLTDVQKNTNHKDAENKRRNAIREQFTRLSKIVPETEGRERSEYEMLQKTVAFFKQQIEESRELIAEIEGHGGVVEENLKIKDNDWAGPGWTPTNVNNFEKSKAKDRGKDAQNGSAQGDEDE